MTSEPSQTAAATIAALFRSEETTLRAALEKARTEFANRGQRGFAVENAVRSFLRAHLPRRLDVGTGEVIDRFGSHSSQLDVVILNEDQPLTYGPEQSGLYLAEGVSAVGEVKTLLDGDALDDILRKGEQLRLLRPSHSTGDTVHSNPHDIARFVMSFPYFAIAMESRLSLETIHERLSSASLVHAVDGSGGMLSKLDALFVLDSGALMNIGDGTGTLRYVSEEGHPMTGWVNAPDLGPLAQMFMWINGVMPRVVRNSSIALPYLSGIA